MNVPAVSRRFGAAALVIGPLGLVLGSLFQVVSDDDSVSASLAKIAAHPSGERAEIICDLLAAFMVPAVLYLMRLSGPRAPRLTLAGGAVSFASWMAGLYSVGASDLLHLRAAQSPDRAGAVSLVRAVTGDAVFTVPAFGFIVGHMLGMLLLGIALWHSRAVPRWAAALVGLASLAQVPVHDSGVGSAVAYGLLLIGMAACAVTLLRTRPEPDPALDFDASADTGAAGAAAPVTR
jgi:hypothetical protein